MTPFAFTLAVLAVGLALDRLVGDPPAIWWRVPHPVVLIGRAIEWLDAKLNEDDAPFAARRRNGVAAIALLSLAALFVGWIVEARIGTGRLGLAVEAVIVAVLLAQKSLVDHVAAVERALRIDGVAGGRKAVAQIVGRDVSVLDEAGVARAAIESAAENFADGVVAPAFWFLLLGLPGLLLYKVVNTANSMIGHRSPRHEAFGWAAARFDDLLNLAPARLSALLIAAAAALSRGTGGPALATARTDAKKHKSPNAGWPEAALAGALGLALGGPRRYGTLEVDGAWFNQAGRQAAEPDDIAASLRLIDMAWALLIGVTALAALLMLSRAQ